MTPFETDFQNYHRDVDRWVALYGGTRTLFSGQVVRTGSLKAGEFLRELYIAHGAFDPLIDVFGAAPDWRDHAIFNQIHEALLARRDIRRLKRLWGMTLAEQKSAFWEYHAFCRQKGPFYDEKEAVPLLARDKARVLDTLDHVANLMESLGEHDYARQRREERGRIAREERGKKLGKPIDRKMDEDVFWELVETAARDAEAPGEAPDRLTQALEAFKPGEIGKFNKLLDAQMDALNSWDVLALAYLALDGASDDTFEYFRAWLIFEGRAVCAAAVGDVESLAGRVRYGEGRIEGLASVAPNAYENRSGKPLKPRKPGDRRMKGAPWEEADLPARYPRLRAALGLEAAI